MAGEICVACSLINNRKRVIRCSGCDGSFHLSCVGLKRAQALALGRWSCASCRGIVNSSPVQQQADVDLVGYICKCRARIRVLNRIPKGAVVTVADALTQLIREVLESGTRAAWGRFMSFSYWGIRCLKNDGVPQESLSTLVKRQVSQFLEAEDLPEVPEPVNLVRSSVPVDGDAKLRKRVSAKFAEGDVGGAVRELASSDGLAPFSGATLDALKSKHPQAPSGVSLPLPPDSSTVPFMASEVEVRKAVESFRPGSAGGPDGLRPGHLRTLLGRASVEAGVRLLTALTDLVNMILEGKVPEFAISTFFGASLCALTKKGGGIRPIAVGNTIRRLATKVGARPIQINLGRDFEPVQLGVSVKGGAEAAAHAARYYLSRCSHRRVFLKIDMKNAFNCLRRDVFLAAARDRAQGLYSLLWQAYSTSTTLFYGEETLVSATGIQQGDPFGPALFALGVDQIARGLCSEFNVWYLDDATLGDTPEKVLEDVQALVGKLSELGLEVNGDKCELSILGHESTETEQLFRDVLPGIRVVNEGISLLGAPVSSEGVLRVLESKKEDLDRMASRLEVLDSHQAFVLLRSAFAIPKLQYVLRASPAYLCTAGLLGFDGSLRKAVENITNVGFDEDSWVQAGLPVSLGGLGVRRAVDVALPAFAASMHSVGELVEVILSRVNMTDTNELAEAGEAWKLRSGENSVPATPCSQKAWDVPLASTLYDRLLREADQVGRARLLASARPESGAWLNAVPVSSLGTALAPDVLRVSVALRVGARICEPHPCRCGRVMDARGLHGLSCRYSAGRHPRHAALNDVVKRALLSGGLPAMLEPPGLDRGDGARPDGITVFPFKHGKSLVWDCTCVDTFAESHLNSSAVEAGFAAGEAETRKRRKYAGLGAAYIFEPIAIETTGVYGNTTGEIVKEIGRHIYQTTGDSRETAWFRQRLALAVQRGNAFSILAAGRERSLEGRGRPF